MTTEFIGIVTIIIGITMLLFPGAERGMTKLQNGVRGVQTQPEGEEYERGKMIRAGAFIVVGFIILIAL